MAAGNGQSVWTATRPNLRIHFPSCAPTPLFALRAQALPNDSNMSSTTCENVSNVPEVKETTKEPIVEPTTETKKDAPANDAAPEVEKPAAALDEAKKDDTPAEVNEKREREEDKSDAEPATKKPSPEKPDADATAPVRAAIPLSYATGVPQAHTPRTPHGQAVEGEPAKDETNKKDEPAAEAAAGTVAEPAAEPAKDDAAKDTAAKDDA